MCHCQCIFFLSCYPTFGVNKAISFSSSTVMESWAIEMEIIIIIIMFFGAVDFKL